MTLPQELIRRKRDGAGLSADEIKEFFGGFLAGRVTDYQMAAMLMAVTIRGMSRAETAELTRVMRDSGEVLAWAGERRQVVDKHSTGGVGDKTSMLLVPLVSDEDVRIPMMAGRGLGHTGGTLDKLEAVGWNVYMPPERVQEIFADYGAVIMGQTETLAPLDRRLYALRDVTATVESIPLIVGSILSKKLAEGLGGLVMDVKFGSGAFMREYQDARALAVALKEVGQECGLNVRCLLTGMDSPLGDAAGNALEIRECLQVMRGEGPADVEELTVELGAEMVALAHPGQRLEEIRPRLRAKLRGGLAYERFVRLTRLEGGDPAMLERPDSLLRAKERLPVPAAQDGWVSSIDVRTLGLAVVELGGGRRAMTDRIDPWVGLTGMKHVGDRVARGEPLCMIHAADAGQAAAVARRIAGAYRIGAETKAVPVIAERL